MEQAGRFVFPIFAIVLGLGLQLGRQRWRQFWRLAAFAAVAQLAVLPLIQAGTHLDQLTVLVTLAAGVLLVWSVETWREGCWLCSYGLLACAILLSYGSEYGFAGAALVYCAWSGRVWSILLCLAALAAMQSTVVPVLAPLMFLAAERLWSGDRGRSPKMLFGAAYVLHFALLSAWQWVCPVGA